MYVCSSLQHFEDMLIVKFPLKFLWKFSVMISISLFNLQLYPDNVGIRRKMLQLFLCLHVSLKAIWWITCIYIYIDSNLRIMFQNNIQAAISCKAILYSICINTCKYSICTLRNYSKDLQRIRKWVLIIAGCTVCKILNNM